MAVNIRIRNGLHPDIEYGDGGATEGDIRGNMSDLIARANTIVADMDGGHCEVTQTASPSMQVVVEQGVGYIPNTGYDEFNSDSISLYEAVVSGAENERTLSIASNSSGQVRIDLICIKLDTTIEPDEYASNIAELIVVEGSPGAGESALPPYHCKLAKVTVANGATEITTANITDSRTQLSFKQHVLGVDDWIDKTDATTITFNILEGKKQRVTIAGNRTLTLSNFRLGQAIMIAVTQDGSGNRTPTWGGGISVQWMTDNTILSLANKTTVYCFVNIGSNLYQGYKVGESQS